MAAALLFLVAWGALVAMWIAAIVSACRFSEAEFSAAGRTRTSTIVLVAITGWVGGAYYWLVIKRQLGAFKNAAA